MEQKSTRTVEYSKSKQKSGVRVKDRFGRRSPLPLHAVQVTPFLTMIKRNQNSITRE